MLSSNRETASTFFNEIDVALFCSLTRGIYGALQLSVAAAFVNLFLKIAVQNAYFSPVLPLLLSD